ncbi:fibrobacter succinogenes major paralogous domain-containing protein [Fibrobacter sp.]|uniref:fibrobacter succinogenes major paralogous domain-containing protein n=1 Tax=Fibrobacter sp. TaxID=35828 RepID=UPI003890B89C
MKKLFLELSFAALCTALLSACGGDSGSSADSLDESSSSSEMDGAESSDSEDLNSNGSEGSEGESSGSEGGESSGSGEGNSSSNFEEPDSSSSEDVESSGSGEGSSASVPGGSSDASIYNASANTLTDLRDGQTYNTVTIGTQTWMAENLNYSYTGVPFDNGYYTSDSTSWCYGDDPANCAKYGRLYTWVAAMDSVGTWSTSGKGCGYGKTCSVASAGSTTLVRGICPKGWHLPSHDEWEALFTAVGGSSTAGSKLKSQTGWTAYSGITNEDAFGFSALPAGGRYRKGNFDYDGYYANFWSSTESDSYSAYFMRLYYDYDNGYLYDYYKYFGFSVRCLMD